MMPSRFSVHAEVHIDDGTDPPFVKGVRKFSCQVMRQILQGISDFRGVKTVSAVILPENNHIADPVFQRDFRNGIHVRIFAEYHSFAALQPDAP